MKTGGYGCYGTVCDLNSGLPTSTPKSKPICSWALNLVWCRQRTVQSMGVQAFVGPGVPLWPQIQRWAWTRPEEPILLLGMWCSRRCAHLSKKTIKALAKCDWQMIQILYLAIFFGYTGRGPSLGCAQPTMDCDLRCCVPTGSRAWWMEDLAAPSGEGAANDWHTSRDKAGLYCCREEWSGQVPFDRMSFARCFLHGKAPLGIGVDSSVLYESIASQLQAPPAKISSGKLRLALLPNKKKRGRRDLDYSAGSAASNVVAGGAAAEGPTFVVVPPAFHLVWKSETGKCFSAQSVHQAMLA